MVNVYRPDETPEELRIRIDEILKRNSKEPVFCICCLEEITESHSLVETIHGPYHGLPKTCVEGRD